MNKLKIVIKKDENRFTYTISDRSKWRGFERFGFGIKVDVIPYPAEQELVAERVENMLSHIRSCLLTLEANR